MIAPEQYFAYIAVFILGAMIGSFLNVVIYRIPKGQSIIYPASNCQKCHTKLKWYHNIPIFSWLFLGGKCAFCNAAISKQYPVIEISTAILLVSAYYTIGPVWYFPFIGASFAALLALSIIDIKYYAVPDSINFFALAMSLVQPDYLRAGLDAIIASASLWTLAKIVSLVTKKEAMGGADVIVAGTMAALLGFPDFFIAMYVAAVMAIIPSLLAKETKIPFVPFLALGTILVYLNGHQVDRLMDWIFNV